MKKQVSALADKCLTKAMALMESERVQELLASPKAQRAMEIGVNALESLAKAKEAAKASIASGLGLATQRDLDALKENIGKVEEKISKD